MNLKPSSVPRVSALTVALALTASGLGVVDVANADETPPEVDCSASASTLEEAGAIAVACGTDVAVDGLTDPWSTTTVRADGLVEWNSSIAAERSQTGAGDWVPVDTTFEPAQSGRIAVAAPAVEMSFSDGTDGQPLVVMSKNGHEIAYDMSFNLPSPLIDTANRKLTYPDVLSGVDLIVTVAPDGSGFSEVLRFDNKNSLPVIGGDVLVPVNLSDGLAWNELSDGSFEAVDPNGDPVFVSPIPVAWDSAAGDVPENIPDDETTDPAGVVAPLDAPLDGEVADGDEVNGVVAENPDRTVAPIDGDQVVPLDVTIGADGEDLSLRIDEDLIDSAVFPLYVDPSVSGSLTGRAYVQSGWPTSAHWNDAANFMVGYCSTGLGCSRNSTMRSFFQFSTSGLGALTGADISSATLTLYGQHSYSCTATEVQVWHTGGISSGTTWNAQPGWSSVQSSQSLAHKAACSNARDIAFGVTGAARSSADQNSDQLTLGVRAADESTITGWKRYENPRLSVTYSRAPNVATGQKVNGAAACGTSSAPTLIMSATPTFSWVVTDPDGGNVTGNLDLLKSGTMAWDAPETQTLASGSTFSVAVPSGKIAENVVYEWRSGGKDTQRAAPYGAMKSCYVKADLTNPATPGVTAAGFKENLVVDLPSDQKFTISDTSTDVVGYKVGFDMADPSAQATKTADASRNLVVTPAAANVTPGAHTLVVKAVDKAGRTSGIKTFKYAVGRASVAAYWTMNDASATIPDWSPSATGTANGATAAESTAQSLVFATNPARMAGVTGELGQIPGDTAVKLTGASSGTAKEASGAVAPVVSAAKAFTITAFVKASSTSPAGPGVVVSQDGTKASSFAIGQLTTGCPTGMTSCWAFTRSNTDDDAGATSPARVSSSVAITGAWQLLVARYTPGAIGAVGKMELTVCSQGTDPNAYFSECAVSAGVTGKTVTNAAVPAPKWTAAGPLRVGQQIVKNTSSAYVAGNGFNGLVDDVRAYRAVLTVNDVIRIATGGDQAP